MFEAFLMMALWFIAVALGIKIGGDRWDKAIEKNGLVNHKGDVYKITKLDNIGTSYAK